MEKPRINTPNLASAARRKRAFACLAAFAFVVTAIFLLRSVPSIIMMSPPSSSFGLGSKGNEAGNAAIFDPSETFETIADFLDRHSKLQFPISSKLHILCLDELETEKLSSLVPKTIDRELQGEEELEGQGGERDIGSHDGDCDDAESTGYMNLEVGGRKSGGILSGNLSKFNEHGEAQEHGGGESQGQHQSKNCSGDGFVTKDNSEMNFESRTNSRGHYSRNQPPADIQVSVATMERPKTQKSPSMAFGHDVNDILAQKLSMLSSPDQVSRDLYGDFGDSEVREAYGSVNSGKLTNHFFNKQQRGHHLNEHDLATARHASAEINSSASGAMQGNHVSSNSGKKLHSEKGAASLGSGTSSGTGNNVILVDQFESFLQSAQSALREFDLDACEILLQALGRLISTPHFKSLPEHNAMKAKFDAITSDLVNRRSGKARLSPELMSTIKQLAANGKLREALGCMCSCTSVNSLEDMSDSSATMPQLTSQAYRFRGDLNMMICKEEAGNATLASSSTRLDEAERCYSKSMMLAELCSKQARVSIRTGSGSKLISKKLMK